MTGLIGKVNGRFGDAAWTRSAMSTGPIRGPCSLESIAPLMFDDHPVARRHNLMAKEFLAAQDPVDLGVLML